MRRFGTWLKKELRELFPVFLFFLLAFFLLRLTRTVMLAQEHIHAAEMGSLLVGSLIIAKVFLLANALKVTRRFDEGPVLYASLWKTGIYFVGCLVFEFIDGVLKLMREGDAILPAFRLEFPEFKTAPFWVLQLWLVILLFAYSATTQLIEDLGKDRFRQLFFGEPEKWPFRQKLRRQRPLGVSRRDHLGGDTAGERHDRERRVDSG